MCDFWLENGPSVWGVDPYFAGTPSKQRVGAGFRVDAILGNPLTPKVWNPLK